MSAVPALEGWKVRVHVVGFELPERSHEGLSVPLADPASVEVTVPVGAIGLAVESETVTVQVDNWLTSTGVSQDRLVVVVWAVTVRSKIPLLTSWVESPE